jgi:hypothetical protein
MSVVCKAKQRNLGIFDNGLAGNWRRRVPISISTRLNFKPPGWLKKSAIGMAGFGLGAASGAALHINIHTCSDHGQGRTIETRSDEGGAVSRPDHFDRGPANRR